MIKELSPAIVKPTLTKKLFWKVAKKLNADQLISLLLGKNSYLIERGWFSSAKSGQSTGKSGRPIPWLTYPFIEFIEARLHKDIDMFEFGCGNSTLWFAERVGNVDSVEHDKKWYEEILPKLPDNATLTLREVIGEQTYSIIAFKSLSDESSYSSTVSVSNKLYDVILVDGVYRNNSIVHSIRSLKEGGIIILDNVDYIESRLSKDYLKELGFKQIDFWGMCPVVHHDSCTSVFYRSNNCLGI